MPGQSEPGSNGNEGVLRIPQGPSITGISPSDCLVSYPGHSLGVGVLPLCRGAVGVFYSPSRLGKSFVCTKFKCQIVLFDPKIEPYQVLPLKVRVDLGVMEMKGYSTFTKYPALLKPHHQIVQVSYSGHSLGEFYPSVEMQPAYSTAPANWASLPKCFSKRCHFGNIKEKILHTKIHWK